MNIAVIGSGGREHSICYKLKQSNKINRLYCIPGNAGTSEISENIEIDPNDFEKIYQTILSIFDLILIYLRELEPHQRAKEHVIISQEIDLDERI